MSKITIGDASSFIVEFLELMENLYWETNSVDVKDQCFNLIRLLQNEITELTKISVQDYNYEYEAINCRPTQMKISIDELENLISGEVLRQRTRELLLPAISKAQLMYS